MELELATGAANWQVGHWIQFDCWCGSDCANTVVIQILILSAWIWNRFIFIFLLFESTSSFILAIYRYHKVTHFSMGLGCEGRLLSRSNLSLSAYLRFLFLVRRLYLIGAIILFVGMLYFILLIEFPLGLFSIKGYSLHRIKLFMLQREILQLWGYLLDLCDEWGRRRRVKLTQKRKARSGAILLVDASVSWPLIHSLY